MTEFNDQLNKIIKSSKAFKSVDEIKNIDDTIVQIENQFSKCLKYRSPINESCKYFCDIFECGSSFFHCSYTEDVINVICMIYGDPNIVLSFPDLLKLIIPSCKIEDQFPEKLILTVDDITYNLYFTFKEFIGPDDPHDILNFKAGDIRNLSREGFEEFHKACIVSIICDKLEEKNISNKTWKNFALTLAVIKLWAKINNCHNETLGYFGDVHWIILVANIYLANYKSDVKTLIHKFFECYSQESVWKKGIWLEGIKCTKFIDNHFLLDSKFNQQLCSTFRPEFKEGYLNIMSPIYPTVVLTTQVLKTTSQRMLESFKCGYEVMNKIMNDKNDIDELFVPILMQQRKMYLIVIHALYVDKETDWVEEFEQTLNFLMFELEEMSSIDCAHVMRDPETTKIRVPRLGENFAEKRWYVFYDVKDEQSSCDVVLRMFQETLCKFPVVRFVLRFTSTPNDDNCNYYIISYLKNKSYPFVMENGKSVNTDVVDENKNKVATPYIELIQKFIAQQLDMDSQSPGQPCQISDSVGFIDSNGCDEIIQPTTQDFLMEKDNAYGMDNQSPKQSCRISEVIDLNGCGKGIHQDLMMEEDNCMMECMDSCEKENISFAEIKLINNNKFLKMGKLIENNKRNDSNGSGFVPKKKIKVDLVREGCWEI